MCSAETLWEVQGSPINPPLISKPREEDRNLYNSGTLQFMTSIRFNFKDRLELYTEKGWFVLFEDFC